MQVVKVSSGDYAPVSESKPWTLYLCDWERDLPTTFRQKLALITGREYERLDRLVAPSYRVALDIAETRRPGDGWTMLALTGVAAIHGVGGGGAPPDAPWYVFAVRVAARVGGAKTVNVLAHHIGDACERIQAGDRTLRAHQEGAPIDAIAEGAWDNG